MVTDDPGVVTIDPTFPDKSETVNPTGVPSLAKPANKVFEALKLIELFSVTTFWLYSSSSDGATDSSGAASIVAGAS